jgi:beta-glucanase (GH16 family)
MLVRVAMALLLAVLVSQAAPAAADRPALIPLPASVEWSDGTVAIAADTTIEARGEIDIMEQVGAEPNLVYASLHTKLFNHMIHTQRSAQKLVPSSCSAFHVYQLDWRPDSITIGVDGKGILRVLNNRPGGKGAWPFFTPYKIILNLAIGGDWAAAKGIDNAAMPQRMQVDYVRVWQVPRGARR